ncbi:hypothetical protein SCP_0503880 [Sparassis crispa]|uniref:BTB domain-containing protein n=1 Tax=Sparassis crispa TaxID=139825 RepID=A0A401GMD6_9APHY|nr:hypothetical protein SCP_0503880 [Sparassis crispa]GBE83340.1 hypothetical protein SCP_0503880 [Sparassis crispa]
MEVSASTLTILSAPSLPDPPDADAPPCAHSKYYLEDDLVIFVVENHLFKVHRYFLVRESDFFRTMFELPPGETPAEGQTDDKAIPLPGVTRREFECLLDFLYYGMHNILSRCPLG